MVPINAVSISTKCDELKNLLIKKNSAYGNSANETPIFSKRTSSRESILIRMGDKVRRLETLLDNPNDVQAETVDDTIMDLAGYCILYLVNGQ